ncbi:hypothetical protein Q7P37_011027 [Cladosporium fusiforme]
MVSIKSLTTAVMAFTTTAFAATGARVTYYTGQDLSNMQLGACEQPQGTLKAPYGAAMGFQDNGNGQTCGKCINVHYQGKSVKVQVIDKCSACPHEGLDLWPGAFETLAPLSVGVLAADWEYTAC